MSINVHLLRVLFTDVPTFYLFLKSRPRIAVLDHEIEKKFAHGVFSVHSLKMRLLLDHFLQQLQLGDRASHQQTSSVQVVVRLKVVQASFLQLDDGRKYVGVQVVFESGVFLNCDEFYE